MSAIDAIAEEYSLDFGSPPFNLSHWDPSDQTTRELAAHLRLPVSPAVAQYLYSYDLDLGDAIKSRLRIRSEKHGCLVVPTGTSAILFAVWWLRSAGVDRVIVLCPSYFPVFYACEVVGLAHYSLYMHRCEGTWELPYEEIDAATRQAGRTAVWVTNPVYCTGSYLGTSQANYLSSLLSRGTLVVMDECLALNGRELSAQLQITDGFVGLYSPHKAVALNAIKFAAIVFPQPHERFFTDWTDVLIGGLGASNHSAVMHFLGDNFDEFQIAFRDRIAEVRQGVELAVALTGGALQLDVETDGYFLSCYALDVPAAGFGSTFYRELVFATGASVIPGSRNRFPSEAGFNFRINLARGCPQFDTSLRRVTKYLGSLARPPSTAH